MTARRRDIRKDRGKRRIRPGLRELLRESTARRAAAITEHPADSDLIGPLSDEVADHLGACRECADRALFYADSE